MSVKHAILGLLFVKPRHGYELKTEFEQMVHKQWPLNAGQIYTTIDRLVRDRLVEPLGEDDQERKSYDITVHGKNELVEWLSTPVERSLFKDEFYFKLLCARKIGYADTQSIVAGQKTSIMQSILKLTRLKTSLDSRKDADMILLLEGSLLHMEADLQWLELLDHSF